MVAEPDDPAKSVKAWKSPVGFIAPCFGAI